MAGDKRFKRRLILPHGGFRKWPAYRCAEVVYDATVRFCERFIKDFRLRDQMVHAARSGKQNIAEGSMIAGVSRRSELRLIGFARGSLKELQLDYEDFLRQRGMQDWDRAHPTKSELRRIAYSRDKSYNAYKKYVEEGSAELAANTIICLIHQTMFLLAKLLQKLEEQFLARGGFTERMHKMRSEARRPTRSGERGQQKPRS
jgi:restriction system protein